MPEPDITTAEGRAAQQRLDDALAFIAGADAATVPPAITTNGPADDEPVDQDPGYEESDVPDDAADTSLADPAVQEV